MYENIDTLQTKVSEWMVASGASGFKIWTLGKYFLFGLLVVVILAQHYFANFSPGSAKNRLKSFLGRDALVVCLFAVTILLLQLPQSSRMQCNTDESQWIAGANTLAHDPRYWLSVDGTTSGPLVTAPLLVIKAFGGSINYGTVKLFRAIVLALSVILTFGVVRTRFTTPVAAMTLLPLAACVATLAFYDLVAYNSETFPVFMVAVGVFLAAQVIQRGPAIPPARLVILGLVLGSVPYAKLQAAPIALVIALYCFFFLGTVKRFLLFAVAGLLPTLLILVYLVSTGILEDFWTSYIVNNLIYAQKGTGDVNVSFLDKATRYPEYLDRIADTKDYFDLQTGIIATSGVLLLLLARKIRRDEYKLIGLAVLVCLTTVGCVIQPGNFFSHYQVLLLVPYGLLAAVLLGTLLRVATDAWPQRRYPVPALLAVLGLGFTTFTVLRSSAAETSGVFDIALINHNNAKLQSAVVRKVLEYARPGDQLAVWGWQNNLYVETGLRQGCRDPHLYYQIRESDAQAYYLQRYAADLLSNKPAFFVDPVSPGAFYFTNRATQGHEHFAGVKKIIDDHYRLLAEIDGYRIFLRKDRKFDTRKGVQVLARLDKLPEVTGNINANVEVIEPDTNFIKVSGWAHLYEGPSRGSTIRLTFSSGNVHYVAEPIHFIRPDVSAFFKNPNLDHTGFVLYIPKDQLPAGAFKVGVQIKRGFTSHFTMTGPPERIVSKL